MWFGATTNPWSLTLAVPFAYLSLVSSLSHFPQKLFLIFTRFFSLLIFYSFLHAQQMTFVQYHQSFRQSEINSFDH